MATENLAGKILKGMDSFVDNVNWGGKSILRSNEPIRKIGNFVMGEANTGIRGTLQGMSEGKGFSNAVKAAYTKNGLGKDLNYKAIAGTYVGAAAAGRVLSGGGLYRDNTGNVNMPVVPFV